MRPLEIASASAHVRAGSTVYTAALTNTRSGLEIFSSAIAGFKVHKEPRHNPRANSFVRTFPARCWPTQTGQKSGGVRVASLNRYGHHLLEHHSSLLRRSQVS